MGLVVKAIGSVLGIGSGAKAPKANVAPAIDQVETEADKAKRARSALLQTAGGQAGDQLQPGQVSGNGTIFGN